MPCLVEAKRPPVPPLAAHIGCCKHDDGNDVLPIFIV
jgi:hypothetical protein